MTASTPTKYYKLMLRRPGRWISAREFLNAEFTTCLSTRISHLRQALRKKGDGEEVEYSFKPLPNGRRTSYWRLVKGGCK